MSTGMLADAGTELDRLKRERRALQSALITSKQNGDILQQQLNRLSSSLTAEVRERQSSEDKLQTLVQSITQEKSDLEILVQILIDQGDESAGDAEKAHIDSLTQIANRRRFDEYLQQEWVRHARIQQPLSLLICDVDHFKLYNDHYGHQAGDECLRAVANILGAGRRANDLLARYGGEEFAVVLPHTDLTGALLVAERLCMDVSRADLPHARSPVSGVVTLSIGVASVTPDPREPGDPSLLIKDADRNLYIAKHRGRNQVSYPGEKVVEISESKPVPRRQTSADERLGKCEYLTLAFSPVSAPLHERWRNNGLSADFIGDYVITFLPREGSLAAESWQSEIKHAVAYIANELLENAMKYHAPDVDIPILLHLELTQDHITVTASNGIGEVQARHYQAFIENLEQGEVCDLLIRQQEQNATCTDPEMSSLGLLTMMSDYRVQLGWRFDPHPLESGMVTVTTSAVLPLNDGSGGRP